VAHVPAAGGRGPGKRVSAPSAPRTWPLFVVLVTAGCGYIGDPLPPLANIPAAVTDLAAVQRGARMIVHFTPPELTTEGRAIKPPLEFDLRIGTAVAPFTAEGWAAHAHPLPPPVVHNGVAETEIPSAPWTEQDITLGVRSIGSNHKASAWSNFVDLTVVPPPQRPTNLKREATANGVRLTWQGDGGDFRVLRRAGDETDFTQIGEAHEPEFLDRTAEFGKAYRYLVQGIVKLPSNRIAESDLSEEVSFTPIDTFPPGAPTGLRAVPAPGSIELTWDQNPEPDVAGYRIYRAAPGGNFTRLTETGPVPSYSDHAVESGKTYRYAVSAVDRAGNESPRSAVAEATAQ
jgi:hypothetical protein